jgi:hypothetical protein
MLKAQTKDFFILPKMRGECELSTLAAYLSQIDRRFYRTPRRKL